MLHPPPRLQRTRSSFQQHPPLASSQSMGSDRIHQLLEAVKALSDEMERIIKQEVLQLSSVLKALVQEIQPTHGQSNKEEVGISISKDVDPTVEKEVVGSSLVIRDMRVGYNYVAEKDQSIRVRLRSGYCNSPFLDPTRAYETKRQADKGKYEAFKRKQKPARRNVGTEEYVDQSFFLELEDPKN
ncbi:hypothetical protein LWI28_028275 [Acer negundo]|uniref:Uncharacterized protein n=1 Tax=Acer negundo TaxID=4023 RepID=A0AAD5P6F3_ACENE|nr:hypothetical protein LWI28_028275 [Acer negundo]